MTEPIEQDDLLQERANMNVSDGVLATVTAAVAGVIGFAFGAGRFTQKQKEQDRRIEQIEKRHERFEHTVERWLFTGKRATNTEDECDG